MRSELVKRSISALILSTVVLLITFWSTESFAALCMLGGGILLSEWWRLSRRRPHGFKLIGLLYIGAAITSLIFLRNVNGEGFVMGLFALVWVGDIMAYLVGKRFGKHKLIPSISPGKSWEGLGASLVSTICLAALLQPAPSFRENALIGVTISLLGLAGDLFESALKRHGGVKDSGALIPGHGGLFDRVDALMPCAILTAILVYFSMLGGGA